MESVAIASLVARGLTHDTEAALAELIASDTADADVESAKVFLEVLACRFDEALDSANMLAARPGERSRISEAACDFALAVSAASVASHTHDAPAEGPLAEFITTLEIEAAMSSGLIAVAETIARSLVSDGPPATTFHVWASVGLTRALAFQGRFDEADEVLRRCEIHGLEGWPKMVLLVGATRVFLDGNLGRADAVTSGLEALDLKRRQPVAHDYVLAGTHVLAAFGLSAIGRLAEAADLILQGGGGRYLPNVQIVDRIYGYEILLEEALSRGDAVAAHTWSELASALPIGLHPMAAAGLGRIKARVAVSQDDNERGIQESADSGVLAALVGGDLEVMRAHILEASARAASGDRTRGIDELEEAARRAHATGASAVKVWAERELATLGRRLRNVPGVGWDALTPTQKIIARLAAAGLRNREIATALYVSEKTVESHVAAVLGALGSTNRVGIGRELEGSEVDPAFASQVTPRQHDVALLVARGLSNGAISQLLAISEKTVEKHIGDLFDRLHVRSRSALAARVRGVAVPTV